MKRGYWVVAYKSVSDHAALKRYGDLAVPAITAGGGRFLVRSGGDAVDAREAGLKQRLVVTEFDTFEQAVATYNSIAYQRALKELTGAVERDFRIVEGVG